MAERFPGTTELPEQSSEIDEEPSNNKHRISSEPADSQGESQQSANSVDQELGCGKRRWRWGAPLPHKFFLLCYRNLFGNVDRTLHQLVFYVYSQI